MSQWDGLSETGPVALYGKRGRAAQDRLRDAVVAAGKPASPDEARAISDARYAIPAEALADKDFKPQARAEEIQAKVVEHLRAADALIVELAAWRGAQVWCEDVRTPYRPLPTVARGAAVEALRRGESMSAVGLMAALLDAYGVVVTDHAPRLVAEHAVNPAKATPQQFGRYAGAAA